MAYLKLKTTKSTYNVSLNSLNSYETISGITSLVNSSQAKKLNIPGANKNITSVSITYRFYYKSASNSSKRRVGIELVYKDGGSEVLYKDDEHFNNYKTGQFLIINYDLYITKSLKELNIVIDTDENTLIDIYNYKVLCGSDVFIEKRSVDSFFIFSKNNNTYMQIAYNKKKEIPIKFNDYYLSSKEQGVKVSIACAYTYDDGVWVSALNISTNKALDSGNKVIIEVDGKKYDSVFLANYDSYIRNYRVVIYVLSDECKDIIFSEVLSSRYSKTFIINESPKERNVNFTVMAIPIVNSGNCRCTFAINHDFEKEFKVDGQVVFYNIKCDKYDNALHYNKQADICDEYGNIIPSIAHEYYMTDFEFNDNMAYAATVTGNFGYTYSSGYIRIQFSTNKSSTRLTRSAFNNINLKNRDNNTYVDKFTANISYYEYTLE